MELKKALAELRKQDKRKFDQTVDLVVNLKGVDVKRTNLSLVVNVPNKVKEKKVAGFLSKKNSLVRTITEPDFAKYKDKNALKNLVKEFDFFIAIPGLMPKVATIFGKVLGPAGKMPSPQLGLVPQEEDKVIQGILDKISKAVKIRVKEASVKVAVGKESMSDEEIIANTKAVYSGLVNALPTKNENVKNVMLKFSMTKPVKVEMK